LNKNDELSSTNTRDYAAKVYPVIPTLGQQCAICIC